MDLNEQEEPVSPESPISPEPVDATPADAEPDVAPDWPENWRSLLAGEDEKLMKRLGDMSSPRAVLDWARNAEKKLSEIPRVPVLPENPTEEQVAKYREAIGVPNDPDGYLEGLTDGLVIGEDDKPILQDFLKVAHDKNLPQSHVNATLDWYYSELEERQKALAEEDRRAQIENHSTLKSEMGREYDVHMGTYERLLDTAPEGLGDRLRAGRLSDGQPIGSNPDFVRWMLDMAYKVNPLASVVPADGGAMTPGAVDQIINEAETLMRTDRKAYNRNNELQERYRWALDVKGRARQ